MKETLPLNTKPDPIDSFPRCACGAEVQEGFYVWADGCPVPRCAPCYENLRTEDEYAEPVLFAMVGGRLYQDIPGRPHPADPARAFDHSLVTPKHLCARKRSAEPHVSKGAT